MAIEKKYRLIVDCSTGEQSSVEFTPEEYAQAELDAQAYAEAQAQREAEATAKAEAKASAIAKLTALGLSDTEVTALIG